MATAGRSENIRIVGDFVCEVIPDPPGPADEPAARGRSEGVRVVDEFVVDLGGRRDDAEDEGQRSRDGRTTAPDRGRETEPGP